MPYLIDIYALTPERSAFEVERFLSHYLPDRQRAEDDYWVTLDGVCPAAEFNTPEEMAQYCETHPDAESRAYWHNRGTGDPHSAHVFFLPAGGLVLGLSVATEDESKWDRWLAELKAFAAAEYGYWTGECPPEATVPEFIAIAQKRAELKANPT